MSTACPEERSDNTVPFYLRTAGNGDGCVDHRDTSQSVVSDWSQSEYLDPPATCLKALGERRPVQPSGNASDTNDWPESVEDVFVAKPVEFAHAYEEEFARMLDTREISWLYKHRTFAVEWDEEGNFADCFTPDFYLPVDDMYIALIAPGGNASSAKTRRVRLLRQHHPEIRIELFIGAPGRYGVGRPSIFH